MMVTRVLKDSFASEIGLQAGDVMLSINRTRMSSAEDIRKIQSTLRPGDAVAVRVMRKDSELARGGSSPFRTFFIAGMLPSN